MTILKTRNVVRDGQTRHGAIAPVPGSHDGMGFEFRPITAPTAAMAQSQIDKKHAEGKSDDAMKLIAKVVSKHIVSWTEADDGGEGLPPTFENLIQLQAPMLYALYNVMTGYRPSRMSEKNNRGGSVLPAKSRQCGPRLRGVQAVCLQH
jgi:hypothetical protein